ncbi:hypothetical protein B0H17DRAFT_1215755 [Mycena rosella]|uniref:Uncharacterized protein n=1 Tax=Mycena rosella TaxID=1033263 RepID=A0AAD7CDY5_MYCRO|nr:hypothetical protein B0H17DRAFT_1215755 [Mycena rosella]
MNPTMNAAVPAASAAQSPTIYEGSIEKLKKPKLQALCEALSILPKDIKGKTKDKLVGLVNTTLEAYPSYEDDAAFAALYKYRWDHSGKGKKTKKTISFIANLELHQQKITTDPVGSLHPLTGAQRDESTILGNEKKPEYKPPSASASSVLTTSSFPEEPIVPVVPAARKLDEPLVVNTDEEDSSDEGQDSKLEGLVPNFALPKLTQVPTSVLVTFRHHTNKEHPAQAAMVKAVNVTKSETPGDTVKHDTALTELVPLALNMNSPMKGTKSFYCAMLAKILVGTADRAGHLLRPAVSGNPDEPRMPIGSIRKIRNTMK